MTGRGGDKGKRPGRILSVLRGGAGTHAHLATEVGACQDPSAEQHEPQHRGGSDAEVGPVEAVAGAGRLLHNRRRLIRRVEPILAGEKPTAGGEGSQNLRGPRGWG